MKKRFGHYFLSLVSILLAITFTSLLVIYSASSNSEVQYLEGNSFIHKGGMLEAVPFITLRNKTGKKDAAKFYGGERSAVSMGYCHHSTISLNSLRPVAEKAPFYIPEDIVTLDSITETGSNDFWKNINRSPDARPSTLYIHGFNIDFEKGCRRAALFQKSYGLTGRFLFFSWPSDGVIINYTRDEADVYWSAEPLRQTLTEMIAHFGKGNANVVAHSLGTRSVLFALASLAQTEQGDEPLLNQIVLIAPDIDAGVFEQYLPLIRPLAKNITLYVSGNDSPLMLSAQVHGYPRLGEPGTHLDGLNGIEIIDISEVSIRSPSGHVYHLHHNAVINDLAPILNENRPASQRSNLKKISKNYWELH